MAGETTGAGKETLALIRLSAELTTKAQGTRRRFGRRLASNIRDGMRTIGETFSLESQWTRLFCRVQNAGPDSFDVLGRIPGISSYSVVLGECKADLDEIIATGKSIFADRVRGHTYAVRARRVGSHAFSSSDILIGLGSALNAGAKVDLSDPQVEVNVEVREQKVYFYSGKIAGMGGLPLAAEGRAVCLLSGGFDSAVAAWMMLRRGVQMDYVFCNLAGEAYERTVVQVAKILADQWSYGHQPRLYILDFAPLLDELKSSSQPRFWQVVLKRLMYRSAEAIARETRAHVIVTGECIGQVSSQTLANLAAIESAVVLPVFRPLIGFEKMDIVDLARNVGTHELSAKVKEYCAIAPGNPVTNAKSTETDLEEAKLDTAVLKATLSGRKILNLRHLTPSDLIAPYLYVDDLPDDAVLVDVRERQDWDTWHHPGAEHRPSWEIQSEPTSLDKRRKYIFYCDRGILSAQAAERMQREGYEAYAYRGGTATLRQQVDVAPKV